MLTYEIKKGLCNALPAKQIREEIFIAEQGFSSEFDDVDEFAYHILVFIDGIAAATGRLFAKENSNEYHIGRVAVLKQFRKQQLGALVVEKLEAHAKSLGACKIVLSAQLQAFGFYEKLGYVKTGEEYLDEHCPHIDMWKAI